MSPDKPHLRECSISIMFLCKEAAIRSYKAGSKLKCHLIQIHLAATHTASGLGCLYDKGAHNVYYVK